MAKNMRCKCDSVSAHYPTKHPFGYFADTIRREHICTQYIEYIGFFCIKEYNVASGSGRLKNASFVWHTINGIKIYTFRLGDNVSVALSREYRTFDMK